MQATELSVFKLITDTFWTALYKRPDLYVYITEEKLSWLGFEGECRTQKLHMIQTLNARSIHYIYLSIDDLRKTADQVLEILSEAAALRGRLFVLRPSRPACLGAENPPFFDQKWHPSVPPPISLLCIYIKAKSEPNSASDWSLLGSPGRPACLGAENPPPFLTRSGPPLFPLPSLYCVYI